MGWKNQTVRAKYPKYASSQDIIDPQTFTNGFKIGLSDGYINENGDLISERLRNRIIPHCSGPEIHVNRMPSLTVHSKIGRYVGLKVVARPSSNPLISDQSFNIISCVKNHRKQKYVLVQIRNQARGSQN